MVKLLYQFLGQDVSNIILDYLYSPDKQLLNMEYNSKFIYKTNEREYLYYSPTNTTINDLHEDREVIISFIHIHKTNNDIYVPLRYTYSSGLNSMDGYK